jgi:hypothetical protein
VSDHESDGSSGEEGATAEAEEADGDEALCAEVNEEM